MVTWPLFAKAASRPSSRLGWLRAHLYHSTDVVTAVVSALNGWRNRVPDAAQREAAVERVRELARGSDRQGMTPGAAKLRTVVVPLVGRPLLDAVRLTDSATVDSVIAAARACG